MKKTIAILFTLFSAVNPLFSQNSRYRIEAGYGANYSFYNVSQVNSTILGTIDEKHGISQNNLRLNFQYSLSDKKAVSVDIFTTKHDYQYRVSNTPYNFDYYRLFFKKHPTSLGIGFNYKQYLNNSDKNKFFGVGSFQISSFIKNSLKSDTINVFSSRIDGIDTAKLYKDYIYPNAIEYALYPTLGIGLGFEKKFSDRIGLTFQVLYRQGLINFYNQQNRVELEPKFGGKVGVFSTKMNGTTIQSFLSVYYNLGKENSN